MGDSKSLHKSGHYLIVIKVTSRNTKTDSSNSTFIEQNAGQSDQNILFQVLKEDDKFAAKSDTISRKKWIGNVPQQNQVFDIPY